LNTHTDEGDWRKEMRRRRRMRRRRSSRKRRRRIRRKKMKVSLYFLNRFLTFSFFLQE
jgi:hypothetical protein